MSHSNPTRIRVIVIVHLLTLTLFSEQQFLTSAAKTTALSDERLKEIEKIRSELNEAFEAEQENAAEQVSRTTIFAEPLIFWLQPTTKRSDKDVYADMDPGSKDDLMGEFSEMNYQLASPDLPAGTPQSDVPVTTLKRDTSQLPTVKDAPVDITKDLHELQRLIGNLQELQRLNLSVSSDLLRKADAKYLETLKKQQTAADDTSKSRRQSVTPLIVMAVSAATGESTTGSATTDTSTEKSAADGDSDLALEPVDVEAAASAATNSNSATEVSSSSSTTTTEEPRNGSLADLEDSFGGVDTNKEEPKPPKRKNGFYFLADWNSFLEVGDGDDQVIVRLSPKIGDPRLFLPVKIP
ncbi:PREDICTED: serine-rich adhesin for platelets [Rhagoletis zephyria]|uniref:serine-rich adhesin for platelets n=1 Tax=Rhagoletis zephyria TaxID=28612 RepID=UPI0008113805|nr:PREDICTED: serine-rich adhesin for platelets [Rhagoletis zephyria]